MKPLARLVSAAPAGVNPDYMGIGPVPASSKALEQAGLQPSDIDLVELNEAFASQSLACVRLLGLDEEKVNVNGGAIALGHPLGSSGARLVSTLVREMAHRDAEYGLATMCIGVGQGIAIDLAAGLAIGERDPQAGARDVRSHRAPLRPGQHRAVGRHRRRLAPARRTRHGPEARAASALDVACGSGKLTAVLARIAGPDRGGWSAWTSARRCSRSRGTTIPGSSSSRATR